MYVRKYLTVKHALLIAEGVCISESVECPVCGHSFAGKPIKNWKFKFYDVRRYECDSCKTKFNVYESPKSKFTIPKSKH